MSKLKNTTALSTSAPTIDAKTLAAIAKAGQGYATAKTLARELILAAGVADKAVRAAFMAGYMVGYMVKAGEAYTLAKAKGAVVATGHGRAVAGKAERSELEEKAYGAARTAWYEVTKEENVQRVDTRGGARNRKPTTDKPTTDKPVVPTAPTAKDAHAHLDMQLAALLAYADKNKAVVSKVYITALQTALQTVASAKAL